MADVVRADRRRRSHVHCREHHQSGATVLSRFRHSDEGQGTIEFALILPPILLILVFGLVEIATLMADGMTIASATREGARLGGAIVNGGGPLGCPPGVPGGSPNAGTVDAQIIAAVERVLTGSGNKITLSDVTEISIWKSDATGGPIAGKANTWTYQLNGGPVVDLQNLDFVPPADPQPWPACSRSNVVPSNVDSVGISLKYTFRGRTPLRLFLPFFNTIPMTDRAVMTMNASR